MTPGATTDAGEKALNSLAVYVRRGYEAEEAWKDRGADAFLDLMTQREAAFHNFRCYEDQARRAGFDIGRHPEALRLTSLVAPQNATLSTLLAEALRAVESQLSRTNAARNVARAYHSGVQIPARYLKQT